MSLNTHPIHTQSSGQLAMPTHRVLRNTYLLLAISMIPTVLGAFIGVQTGLTRALSPGISMAVFFLGAMGFMFVIEKNRDKASGVYFLLAFTFFMGLMLSRLLSMVLGFSNGASLIMTAFGGTAAIFFGMASLGTIIKKDLSGMGKFLTIGAMVLMVGFLINLFVQSSAAMLAMTLLAMVIFSAFIVYDIKRIVDGGETSYVSATLSIYMNIYNVFTSLLSLLGIFGGERD